MYINTRIKPTTQLLTHQSSYRWLSSSTNDIQKHGSTHCYLYVDGEEIIDEIPDLLQSKETEQWRKELKLSTFINTKS